MRLDTIVQTDTNAAVDHLDVGAIRRRLVSDVMGTHIYVFGDVPSTNVVLRGLADAGVQEGTIVLAESQQAAQGRGDTAWFTPPGVNLYGSALFRSALVPAAVPIFGCMTLLAIADTLRGFGVSATVRWPNDVMVAGRKIAIVRVEPASAGHHVPYVVVGLRVNVNVRGADLIEGLGAGAAEATSVREELGRPIDRNAFTAELLTHLEEELRLVRGLGVEAIVRAWSDHDALQGCHVEVTGAAGVFTGRVDGIDTRGDLIVVADADGSRRPIVSGTIRLLEVLS